MQGPVAIILAAGHGKRMKSDKAKVLHEVCGQPMIHYVVDAVRGAGAKTIVVVVGYAADQVREALGSEPDVVFAEQLKNFAKPGDVFLAISGSGNSPNVLRGIETANAMGCKTIAMTGRDGGKLGPLAQLHLHVPNPHMGRIEDAHMAMCHMIAYHFMEESQ